MKNVKTIKKIFVMFLCILASTMLLGVVFALSNYNSLIVGVPSNQGPRLKYNFNYDWQFAKGEGKINSGSDLEASPIETYSCVLASSNPYSTSYTTTGNNCWSNVSLAHTFNDTDTFNNFTESGMNGERSTYTGSSWYKKDFYVPSEYQNKKIYIEFEAARQVAEVYVNGNKVTAGTYQNGFIPFGYDLTSYLTFGATNQITIMVDNSFPYYLNGTSVIPWHDSHWHPNFGGLYRNSYLYVVDQLHLTLPLYSFLETEGTYVYTSDENGVAKTATVNVDAEVENSTANPQTFTVRSIVYNASDVNVLTINSSAVTLAAGEKTHVTISGTLENVIRWSTTYPYLYTVVTQIIQNDTVIDNNITDMGIRTYRFTTNYGFYLNENYVALNGWGQKTTMEYAGLGAAYPDWMTDMVIKLMKDAGGNYIRWGHVAGSPSQIDAANKYGLLVTQPGVDGEGTYESSYSASSIKLRAEAFRDMIIYYRNNPSIVMWEIGNQSSSTDYSLSGTNLTSIGGTEDIGSTSATLAKVLYFFAGKYDYGNRTSASGGKIQNVGTYINSISTSDRILTIRGATSATSPYVEVTEVTNGQSGGIISGKPAVEGEYNRYEARRGIWDTYTNTFTAQNDHHFTSEGFAVTQVERRAAIMSVTSNMGGANWIFSDSTSHGRVNTEVARVSGEVDATMLPKEAYFTNKVLFGATEVPYIIGHWNYQAGTIKTVYVVAPKGVSTVKLFVNSTEYTGTVSNGYLWTFNNVSYVLNSTITAVSYDASNNAIAGGTSSKSAHGTPTSLKLTMINNPEGIKANGSDIVLIDVEVVDADGNRCVTYDGETANDLITFNLSGETNKFVWRGGYNSGREDSTNVNTLYAEAGIIRVAIKTTMNNGTVNLTATSAQGLTSTPLAITSNAIANSDATTGFTGVSPITNSTNYNLGSITDPDYGNGDILGVPTVNTDVTSTILIGNYAYTGRDIDANKIVDAFGVGSKIYSDESVTFTSIPYKFFNAEYLLLPNVDKSTLAVDLINFTAKKDIDVYILRDPAITTNPSWMNDYTKIDETIVGGNGVEYDIYKKTVTKNTTVTIGSNVDTVSALNNGVNQIVMVKETSKVQNQVLFNETTDDYDDDSIANGWNRFTNPDTSVIVDTTLGGNTMHLIDDSLGENDLTFIQKSFVGFDKFKVRFRVYLSSGESNLNRWLRVWLTDGPFVRANNIDEKSNVGIETYLDNNTSGAYLSFRQYGSSSSVNQILSSMEMGAWHELEYTIDTTTGKFTVSLLDNQVPVTTAEYSFTRSGVTNINNIVFGTCVWGKSDYYVDDIVVTPIINDVIDNVKINGTDLTSFFDNVYEYFIPNLNESTVVTFDQGLFYKSHTLTYSAEDQAFTLAIRDVLNNLWTYTFTNYFNNPLFDGWTIHTGTDVVVGSEELDGSQSIHLYDSSTTDMAYIMREITPASSRYKISFDYYVESDNDIVSSWNRVWLTEGVLLGNSIKTNLGPESYISEYYDSTLLKHRTEAIVRYGSTVIQSSGLSTPVTFINNAWHKYEITVNAFARTYDIAIDDVVIFTNIPYSTNTVDVDHIIIGTWVSAAGEINIKNYQFEDIYGSPLTSIRYDGTLIPDFSPRTLDYYVYKESRLTASTPVAITNGAIVGTPTITRDTVAQTVTITLQDLNGNDYTYVVHVLPAVERPVSLAELQALIATIDTDYVSSDYTTRSWETLGSEVEAGRLLNESSTPIQISYAYYHINVALTELEGIVLTNEKSSFVNIVKMSDDIINNYSFDLILENGAEVYNDARNITFRSVPKKYMNANYFLLSKTLLSNYGEIQLTAKRNISVLIFKDRNAGEIAVEDQTSACTNVNNCFIDTGDIVTAVNGDTTIVYKVYRRDYAVDSVVIIDARYLLTNKITQNANIVAIKGQDEVAANAFLIDDTSKYATLADFNNTWRNYIYDTQNSRANYVQSLETVGGEIAMRMESNAGNGKKNSYGSVASSRSFFETTRRFAKLYGRFTVSYYAYVEPVSADYDNNYLRAGWITNGSALDWEVGTKDIKTHVLNETYFGVADIPSAYKGTYSFLYRYGTAIGTPGNSNNYLATVTPGTWISQMQYEIDVRNQNYDVKMGSTEIGTNLIFLPQSSAYDYGDNIMFGTRATGFSRYWFRDVIIEPVEDELINSITVNSNNVLNASSEGYNSITKDYLYSAESLATKNVAVANGTNYGTSTITNVTDYDNIDLTSSATYGNVTLNHRVYYEVACSRAAITATIEKSQNLIEIEYTVDSWEDMVIARDSAIALLDDPEMSCTTITSATNTLITAINNLVKKYEFNIQYTGTITAGNDLTREPSNDINITNNSSVTLRVNFEQFVGATYSYQNAPHVRTFVSSSVLPAGTFITMVDISSTSPKYYYYQVTANDVTSNKRVYPFADFIVMAGSSNYTNLVYYNSVTGYVKEDFIFIVDFNEASHKLANGEYTIKIENDISGELIDMDPLSYKLFDDFGSSVLSIVAGEQSYYKDDDIELSLTAHKNIGRIDTKPIYETRLFNTKLGIVFKLYDSSNNRITMPENTKITYGNHFCYVKNNECRLLLEDITSSVTAAITLNFGLNNNLLAGSYHLKATLLTSIDGMNNGITYIDNDTEFRILEKPNVDFKITLDSYNVIHYGNAYKLLYNILDNVDNSYVVASLYHKGQSDFEIVDLNIFTDENLVVYATNQYNLGDITAWEPTISANIARGTYMLVFDLYNASQEKLSTLNKYFIVK